MIDTDRLFWVTVGAAVLGLAFLLMHEQHYRSRRERIGEARAFGSQGGLLASVEALGARVAVIEEILMEERDS
jgi:hypothetical protein